MNRRTMIKAMIALGLLRINPLLVRDAFSAACSLLFVNGAIYQDAAHRVRNLLVENGLIAGVNVNPADHKNAEVVDLGQGALYPGFCDSHVHLVESALGLSGGDLRGKKTPEAIAQGVAQAMAKHPGNTPLFCAAFSLPDYDAWSLADLARLDAATGDRIVLLADDLGHNLIINSAAIAKAGITAKTPTPPGGKIIIQDGKLTGMLREEAMALAAKPLLPLFDNAIILKGTQHFMNAWVALGYTSIVDLMGAPLGRMMHADMCRDMERRGVLPLRVNYNYTFSGLDDLDGALDHVGKDTELVRFVGGKIFIDGAYAGGQAWTTWKNRQGGHGLKTVCPDDSWGKSQNINRIVARLEELGLNCHYHIQGDRALDVTLDALAAAAAKKGGLRRVHTLIHLAFPRPDQIRQIGTFKGRVVATVQPAFWKVEEGLERYYGELNNSSYPIKELMATGVSVGMSTDFSVSPLELAAPTMVMNIAMTGGGQARKPLSMQELVRGFTQGSAATTGKKDPGTLHPGKKADMVVYERDLYTTNPAEFSATSPKVLSAWVGGRRVFEGGRNPL
jgi:predicted amidohydrolase YtcJ